MEIKTKVIEAAIAGLLHDIGKFSQRAGDKGTRIWDEQAKQDYKYQHALLSGDFLTKHLPQTWQTPIKHLAANHHKPTNASEQMIRIADQLSASERAKTGAAQEDTRSVHPKQLKSIFSSIVADGQTTPQDRYLPLNVLQMKADMLFPGEAITEESRVWQAYQKMWDEFRQEAESLAAAHQNNGDMQIYLESLLLLMQRYTWCIPSAYFKSIPDISLYDHSRMTAALASILVDSDFSDQTIVELSERPFACQEDVALLVGGDLSGVQDFIYTITSRGATSALRGRSFYLQLLTETIARYTLSQLGLPITNLIYAGGGNFYLLARAKDAHLLPAIQNQVSRVLIQHHGSDLYLALSNTKLKAADFFEGRFRHQWRELAEGLQRVKNKRYASLQPAEIQTLFEPKGHGGNIEKQCRVCGVENLDTKPDKEAVTADDPDGVRKCPACFAYETLGEELRKARFLSLEFSKPLPLPELDPDAKPGNWNQVLQSFGIKAHIIDNIDNLESHNATRSVVYALQDSGLSDLKPGPKQAVGRRYLVNVTPTITQSEIQELRARGISDLPKSESTKPFHVMEAQAQGIKRLGVLRMDVDNLGSLFSEGLQNASLSRTASLSTAISLFFDGWVEVLANRRNQSCEVLYSIYSGGDDLFFVGAWDQIVELAREIRMDLTRYAANHPGIHASAGISLVGGKYPLAQAAQDAGRAEANAKHYTFKDHRGEFHEKDAICFLNQTLSWRRFGLQDCTIKDIHSAHALMHLLTEEINSNQQTPLIRRLLTLHERYCEVLEERQKQGWDLNRAGGEQILWGPWNWLSYYSLSRLIKQYQDPNIIELRDQLKADDFRSIEWIGLAARWGEFILR